MLCLQEFSHQQNKKFNVLFSTVFGVSWSQRKQVFSECQNAWKYEKIFSMGSRILNDVQKEALGHLNISLRNLKTTNLALESSFKVKRQQRLRIGTDLTPFDYRKRPMIGF